MSTNLSHARIREIGAAPVTIDLPRPRPERIVFEGRTVTVEPMDADRHAEDLFPLVNGSPERDAVWDYLPYGPFATLEEYHAWMAEKAAGDDPLFYSIRVKSRDRVEGVASLMEIRPATGVIEIGHINISPSLQNSVEATEGLYLLMTYAMDTLGYRRFEWKCNALNAGSRSAASRLGFSYEGVFYQHVVVKGRNRDTAWFSILDSDWPAIRANFERWLDPGNFDENGRQKVSLGELNRGLQ
ncbi:MAG: GNAT family N-acetyltransferase [Chloroflexota bacterium]|nr:GNAT family N-acetyltransferase [Chloroflexota bacterium]